MGCEVNLRFGRPLASQENAVYPITLVSNVSGPRAVWWQSSKSSAVSLCQNKPGRGESQMSEPSRNTASGLYEQVRHIDCTFLLNKPSHFDLIQQQQLYRSTRV